MRQVETVRQRVRESTLVKCCKHSERIKLLFAVLSQEGQLVLVTRVGSRGWYFGSILGVIILTRLSRLPLPCDSSARYSILCLAATLRISLLTHNSSFWEDGSGNRIAGGYARSRLVSSVICHFSRRSQRVRVLFQLHERIRRNPKAR